MSICRMRMARRTRCLRYVRDCGRIERKTNVMAVLCYVVQSLSIHYTAFTWTPFLKIVKDTLYIRDAMQDYYYPSTQSSPLNA
jgi:hypothetical protein